MVEDTAYEIWVRDVLDIKWAAYFAPFTLTIVPEGTLLRGVVHDQAELFGILLKVRDMGIRLISISPVRESNPG